VGAIRIHPLLHEGHRIGPGCHKPVGHGQGIGVTALDQHGLRPHFQKQAGRLEHVVAVTDLHAREELRLGPVRGEQIGMGKDETGHGVDRLVLEQLRTGSGHADGIDDKGKILAGEDGGDGLDDGF
jgi:hypothetical protein